MPRKCCTSTQMFHTHFVSIGAELKQFKDGGLCYAAGFFFDCRWCFFVFPNTPLCDRENPFTHAYRVHWVKPAPWLLKLKTKTNSLKLSLPNILAVLCNNVRRKRCKFGGERQKFEPPQS